jgi:ABC-type transport system substrate-binding protein
VEERELAGRRLGGFQLRERLGRGGFATVWRADQLRLDREVAVKVLDADVARNPDAARRFEREGRAAASLDHPNIVPVYEAGDEDGIVYLAMRLVDGPSLEEVLASEGHLNDDQLAWLVEPLAAALDHSHQRGLVHRDVKPSNILIDDDNVWLSDFGIAATTRDAGRYTTGTIGTAAYMAPEQAQQGDIGGQADLYSLGCVVFECVTGHLPFDRDDLVAMLMAHVNDPVPPCGRPELDGFFQRAMAKDPAERFESGAAFVASLRSALGRDSIPAAATAVTASGAVAQPTEPLERTVAAQSEPSVAADPSAPPRRRRRAAWLVPVAVVAVLLVTAAAVVALSRSDGEGEAAPPPPSTAPAGPVVAEGGEVSAGFDIDLTNLNPNTNLDIEPLISTNVLPTLFTLSADFEWIPNVSDGEPVLEQEDPQVVRYTIRDDAVWDDGSPITSADAQATLAYIQDPASGVEATEVYRRVGSLEVVDDTEFRVTFSEPLPQYRALFSTFHPLLKKDAIDAYAASGGAPAEFLSADIPFSGGPYRVVGYDPGLSVRLARNDAWWGTEANLDRITTRSYAGNDTILEALQSGDVDLAFLRFPNGAQVQEASDVSGFTAEVGPSAYWVSLIFSVRDGTGPLTDPLVRQAVASAIDRRAIADSQVGSITGEAADPLQSLVYVPEQPAYDEAFARWEEDEDQANRLLDEAGWTYNSQGFRAKDGQQLIIDLNYDNDDPAGADMADLAITHLFNELEDVGVSLRITQLRSEDFNAAVTIGAFQVVEWRNFVNADPEVTRLRYDSAACPETVPGCSAEVGSNWGAFTNPEVDQLLDQTAVTFDDDERTEIFHQIDQLLADDLPALPMYQLQTLVAQRDGLVNVRNTALRGGPLNDLTVWGWEQE